MVACMIYGVIHNEKRGIGYISDKKIRSPLKKINQYHHVLIYILMYKYKNVLLHRNPKLSETLGKLTLKDPKDYGYQKIRLCIMHIF